MTDNQQNVAIVSGGSRNLGLAIVEALLEDGYRVATFSRRPTDEIVSLGKRHKGSLLDLRADLSRPETLLQVTDASHDAFGPATLLVNNGAVAPDGFLARQSEEEIAQAVNINLTGTLLLTRHVARQMMIAGGGSIISISSIVAQRGYKGVVAYSATKAALDGMTRSLARELGGRNIRVNAIAPGYMESEMVEGLDEKALNRIRRRTPLGRMGEPADIVPLIRFLASDSGGFISGQTVVIDGGFTC
ncbi:MAG: SDR family oxidoreductase [Rhodospirillales bacterium]